MTNYIELEKKGSILTVILNRPGKNNALNSEMISALMNLVKSLATDKNTDIVVLKGKGDSFCAGADLQWFKKATELNNKERVAQLKVLSTFLQAWHRLPQTTITIGHGNLYGGALGLLAVSDFVILEQNSQLRLSEVLLGLIPASIAPFLIQRMGFKQSKALILSAEKFNANLALSYGLADKIASTDNLLKVENQLIKNIQMSTYKTRSMAKNFLFDIVNKPIDDIAEFSAQALSESINTEIAQESILSFSDKKKIQ